MRKIYNALAFLTIGTLASNANAVGMDWYVTTSYWQTCWINVTAEQFSGSASEDIEDIKVTHNMKYHLPVMEQDITNTNDKIVAMDSQTKTIIKALSDSYEAVTSAKAEVDRAMLKKKLDYIRQLSEAGMNEENFGFFNDGNGQDGKVNKNTQSYAYFKNLCKRNKMFLGATSPEQSVKKSMAVNATVNKATSDATANTSQASQGMRKINKHFAEWCSSEEIKNGICDNDGLSVCDNPSGVCKAGDEFKLTNGDMNAVNLLNPEGEKDKNTIPDELFSTNSTYDEDQEKAATDFAYNVVYAGSIAAPSIKEKQDPNKSSFVYAYQSQLAALDLAHFTFENAIASRTPITEGDIIMSEMDVVRYIMENLKNPDNMIATMAAKDKGTDVALYSILSIKNKLELNKLEQSQRIEVLSAAILAKLATSPNNMKYSDELKK